MYPNVSVKRILVLFLIQVSVVIASFDIPVKAQEKVIIQEDRLFFTAYAYCPCKQCCGKSDGITASGVRAMEGRTIAVDKSVIPLGSTVLIYVEEELYGIFVAEDTGVKGNSLDIFFESHQAAKQFGVKHVAIVVVDAAG